MKRFPAFSLVEIAIGLFIVGLLLAGVMKGTKLMDSAKIQTCISQILNIHHDFQKWLDERDPSAINIREFPLTEKPKIGGKFMIEDQGGKYLVSISNNGGQGFLSPQQAKEIRHYFPESTIDGCDLSGASSTCKIAVPLG